MIGYNMCGTYAQGRIVIALFLMLLQVGVKTIVVYINKADAVNDPEMLELVCSSKSVNEIVIM